MCQIKISLLFFITKFCIETFGHFYNISQYTINTQKVRKNYILKTYFEFSRKHIQHNNIIT